MSLIGTKCSVCPVLFQALASCLVDYMEIPYFEMYNVCSALRTERDDSEDSGGDGVVVVLVVVMVHTSEDGTDQMTVIGSLKILISLVVVDYDEKYRLNHLKCNNRAMVK